jgi:purine-binding chemotaxis protein CheW
MTVWDDLRAILRETAEILNRGDQPTADTLEQRTRQLARPAAERGPERGTGRFLTFSLGTERYGWPVDQVQAIARVGHVTPVPSAPAYYQGVTSLRGQVLSVMDLGVYLGLPPLNTPPELMIVINGAGLEIGALASEIFDVLNVPADRLSPPSSAGLDPELILGVTADGLTLLDAETLLRRERYRAESSEG